MKNYSGDFTIPVSREMVWNFLMDPHKVGPCLPDLLSMDVTDNQNFRAKVRVGLGPIRGAFDLANVITIEEPGKAASMSVKGGGMGSGIDMSAKMFLEDLEEQQGTLLKWTCDVVVSGPIATIGGRLIDGQARKITEQVFENIRNALISMKNEVAVANEDEE
ncbi:carbon monoxide dehydrogenase subunit G [Brevibacillus sp. SYP-B805]|uniref:CoxG family protein n=1 Tax=Brevibacillus sp. SYP-B805 TaxID=1578199 RepID=UPI0013EC6CA0|nr:carbon monoxide dehydrogenase subunit G [Brevibacillus sp. SYP-B805]NGQ95815.1 carbon monoxide dehydrogenase subunit G [Brevibacillus sp. SYP-B805]